MTDFRLENNAYWLGSERLLRVSEILEDVGLSDKTYVPEYALNRGSVLHKACELATFDKLDWDTLHPDLHGYVKSWLALKTALAPEIIAVEAPIYHPGLKVAGTPDLRAQIGPDEWIIDWKANGVPKHTRYQLSFYDIILGPTKDRWRSRKRAGVALQADGSMARMTHFDDKRDENVAMAALTIYWAKRGTNA